VLPKGNYGGSDRLIAAVFDNDILLKGTRYLLLNDFPACLNSHCSDVGVLGAAKYVVMNLLDRQVATHSKEEAMSHFNEFLEAANIMEPTDGEEELAAELEQESLERNLPFDVGESLLYAIAAHRSLEYLVTGDKRAVIALEKLSDKYSALNGSVVCLEQLLATAVLIIGFDEVRSSVCNDVGADRTASICFSCTNAQATQEDCQEGLESYIGDLAKSCPTVLGELT
jgi:hypothetical protein